MKTAFLVLTVIALLAPLGLRAQDVPDTSFVFLSDSDGELFFSKWCRVFVPKSKNLVQIIVIDEKWPGGILEQVITVEISHKGRKTKLDSRYIIDFRGQLFKKTKGYDIFRKKYYPHIRNLPEPIRSLLKEYYEP